MTRQEAEQILAKYGFVPGQSKTADLLPKQAAEVKAALHAINLDNFRKAGPAAAAGAGLAPEE